MPTYEYKCANGHHFEHFQRMSEAPLDTCPQCGAAAERLLSAGAGLLFKGSGFYITDYRSDSYKKAAAADSGGDGGKPGGDKEGGDKGGGDKSASDKPAASKADSKPSGSGGSAGGSASSSASGGTGRRGGGGAGGAG